MFEDIKFLASTIFECHQRIISGTSVMTTDGHIRVTTYGVAYKHRRIVNFNETEHWIGGNFRNHAKSISDRHFYCLSTNDTIYRVLNYLEVMEYHLSELDDKDYLFNLRLTCTESEICAMMLCLELVRNGLGSFSVEIEGLQRYLGGKQN